MHRFCVGENCKAGDCYGKKCKAGKCYGYGCKPGTCFDPDCPIEKCPQIIKDCQDGTADKVDFNKFYLKNRRYFPKRSMLNPQLCKPYITKKDILDGRADDLELENITYNYKNNVYSDNEKIKLVSSKPSLFKSINCDLCKKVDNETICHETAPFESENGEILWK